MSLKRTLGEIRSDIQIRLGFGMAGQSGVVNSSLIDSMIRSAQNQLYEQFDFLEMKKVDERSTGADQAFYDYPSDCNMQRIIEMSVKYGGRYWPLTEGITLQDRSATSSGKVPQKYERRDQFELWPVPTDSTIIIRTEYIKVLSPLVSNSDRISIPDETVYLHALANAKSHYRQPDASAYSNQLTALLEKIKARHRGRSIWTREKQRGAYDYPPTSEQVI